MCSWKDSIRGESGVVRPECDENALKNQSAWKCYPAPLAQAEEAGWILLESTAARELLKKKKTKIGASISLYLADNLGTNLLNQDKKNWKN